MNAVHVVVMGVSGCGKSAVGRDIAQALALPMIEGDDFHPESNIRKMREGVPLTDADRAGWLHSLRERLADSAHGAVLSCSALKRDYRDILRSGTNGLRFVHLAVTQQESLRRVAARGGHFYPPSLVASQFEALQDPQGEPGVLALDASAPVPELVAQAVQWLRTGAG